MLKKGIVVMCWPTSNQVKAVARSSSKDSLGGMPEPCQIDQLTDEQLRWVVAGVEAQPTLQYWVQAETRLQLGHKTGTPVGLCQNSFVTVE